MSRTASALLLSVVYAAALAVAVTDLRQHAVAGLLVFGGLTARLFLRHRRTGRAPSAVLAAAPDAVPVGLGVEAVPAARAA